MGISVTPLIKPSKTMTLHPITAIIYGFAGFVVMGSVGAIILGAFGFFVTTGLEVKL